jgi:uncharacterized membrane protein
MSSAFGENTFGLAAEKAARFFGTPRYILGQTVIVALWIVLNSIALIHHWDPTPFIMLNLIFSTQAAYAAPLILLAQTRQAERDKTHGETIEKAHSKLEHAAKMETDSILELLRSNTQLTEQSNQLTEQVADLTKQIHQLLLTKAAA